MMYLIYNHGESIEHGPAGIRRLRVLIEAGPRNRDIVEEIDDEDGGVAVCARYRELKADPKNYNIRMVMAVDPSNL